jgi:hypothetical protein
MDDNFLTYSLRFGVPGSQHNPKTVALVDALRLTEVEHGEDGSKLAKSITLHIVADATELFIANLQKALEASRLANSQSYDEQERLITLTVAGGVTGTIVMRLFSLLYKQQAIVFNDLVAASKRIGVVPPPPTLDTVKRDLTELWVNPNPQAMEPHAFGAPYFKFNPSLRMARGPALVDVIELSLDRATRYSPCVTMHISPKATDLFLANLQAALEEGFDGKQNYNTSTHKLTVVPFNSNLTQEQMVKILEILHETKAISYNDQVDASDTFKVTPPEENPALSKEKRDLTDLCK